MVTDSVVMCIIFNGVIKYRISVCCSFFLCCVLSSLWYYDTWPKKVLRLSHHLYSEYSLFLNIVTFIILKAIAICRQHKITTGKQYFVIVFIVFTFVLFVANSLRRFYLSRLLLKNESKLFPFKSKYYFLLFVFLFLFLFENNFSLFVYLYFLRIISVTYS